MPKEIWKDIVGYEGKYQISNYARVKSLKRKRPGDGYILKERLLKPGLMKVGYYSVALWKNCKQKTFHIHRLVAKYFIPNPKGKREVNHIDGNKTNNLLSNLEWVTPKENCRHAQKTGLVKNRKPVIQLNLDGSFVKRWDCVMDCERADISNNSLIVRVLKKRGKTSGGFRWKYAYH